MARRTFKWIIKGIYGKMINIANIDCVVIPAVIPNKLAVTTVSLLIIFP
jgi:hypothetical protein